VLDEHKVGDQVALSVVRGGVKRKVDVVLQELP
jgi:S1-C subfamily serine protease